MQRAAEVAELEGDVADKQKAITRLDKESVAKQAELAQQSAELNRVQSQLNAVKTKKNFVALNARQYDEDPKYDLPEPKLLMSVKSYRDNVALAVVCDLKDVIRRILLQFFEKTRELQRQLDHTNEQVEGLARLNYGLKRENESLSLSALNLRRLRQYIGADKTDEIIKYVEALEITEQQRKRFVKRDYVR